jgi:hypothetical protein
MNKLLLILIILMITTFSFGAENCRNLPGFKKHGKDSSEYIYCITERAKEKAKKESKSKFKLNTGSKLTDWFKNRKK